MRRTVFRADLAAARINPGPAKLVTADAGHFLRSSRIGIELRAETFQSPDFNRSTAQIVANRGALLRRPARPELRTGAMCKREDAGAVPGSMNSAARASASVPHQQMLAVGFSRPRHTLNSGKCPSVGSQISGVNREASFDRDHEQVRATYQTRETIWFTE